MTDRFEAFAGSIMELSRYLQKLKDIEMKRLGLRATHGMCLYYLGRSGGLTSSQLSRLCKEDKAAVSRCVNQLLSQNLITCQTLENKRSYRTPLYLTDEGKALVQTINERIEAAIFSGGKGLDEEQRKIFYEAMGLILHNLEQYISQQKEELPH